MRILMVVPYYLPYVSGVTIYAKRVAEGLAKRGHEVKILTIMHKKKLKTKEILNGVEVIRSLPLMKISRGTISIDIFFKFMKLIKKTDIVNVHLPFPDGAILAFLSKIFGRRILITYHCDLNIFGSIIHKFIQFVYISSAKIAAKLSDKIILNSIDYGKKSKIKKFYRKMIGIYPPIDDSKFREINFSNNTFVRKYKIKKNDKVIGFLGRLVTEKGLNDLIYAFEEVKEEFPDSKLFLAGEGENIAGGKKESTKIHLQKTIKKLGLKKSVYFTGFLEDFIVPDFLSACNVFTLPSMNPLESFGMVQVEALLCGTSVVSTDLPGVRDVVRLTHGGITVPQKNKEKLASAIKTILKNPKKYNVSRKNILKYFSMKKTLDDYESLMKNLLEKI